MSFGLVPRRTASFFLLENIGIKAATVFSGCCCQRESIAAGLQEAAGGCEGTCCPDRSRAGKAAPERLAPSEKEMPL